MHKRFFLIQCLAAAVLPAAAQVLFPVLPPEKASAAVLRTLSPEQDELLLFKKSYPKVQFSLERASDRDDWILYVTSYGRTTALYRADGKYLSGTQLALEDDYKPVLYPYPSEIPDPADFSDSQIKKIKEYADYSRQHTSLASTALFSAIYGAETQSSTESRLVSITFLGKKMTVHEQIALPLERVQKRIKLLAVQHKDTADFVKTIKSADCYSWRSIRDRDSRSFHSYGAAVDILPESWNRKILYWAWERGKNPDSWMLVPVSKRWMPPADVISAFEAEGFIWGGRWIVWDNMHFEYHPELLSKAVILNYTTR